MSACKRTGKVRYRTELDAKIRLAKLQWKDHGEKRCYRCPFCRGWHTTSQEKKGMAA